MGGKFFRPHRFIVNNKKYLEVIKKTLLVRESVFRCLVISLTKQFEIIQDGTFLCIILTSTFEVKSLNHSTAKSIHIYSLESFKIKTLYSYL